MTASLSFQWSRNRFLCAYVILIHIYCNVCYLIADLPRGIDIFTVVWPVSHVCQFKPDIHCSQSNSVTTKQVCHLLDVAQLKSHVVVLCGDQCFTTFNVLSLDHFASAVWELSGNSGAITYTYPLVSDSKIHHFFKDSESFAVFVVSGHMYSVPVKVTGSHRVL